MRKPTIFNDARGASAALWTPWGIQRRPERDAQKLAIRRLVRRVAEISKRGKFELVGQRPDRPRKHDA